MQTNEPIPMVVTHFLDEAGEQEKTFFLTERQTD
jgi:hypothetical protein